MSLIPLGTQPVGLRSAAASLVCIAGCAGLAAALIFSAFPGIDLAVSRLFYLGGNDFLIAKGTFGDIVRKTLRLVFTLTCVAVVAGFIMIAFFNRRILGLGFAAWLYLGLCIAIGPGLVANVLFKDHWGRARPVQVVEFGGTKQFTPALTQSDQCERNCSFVSGEASNVFIIGFALALLIDASRRRQVFAATIAGGAFAGLLRVGAGGHFLSDVVFAGVFMAFVARGLAWLIFEQLEMQLADGGPLHRQTHRAGRLAAYYTLRAWRAAHERWRRRKPR